MENDLVLLPQDLLTRTDVRATTPIEQWTKTEYEDAGQLVKVLGKEIDDRVAVVKEVHESAWKAARAVTALQNLLTERLETARTTIRRMMSNWIVQETVRAEGKAAAERARLLTEAENERCAEAELAGAWNGPAAAEAVMVEELSPQPVVMARPVPRIEGIRTRMKPGFRIVNFNMLVAHALECLRHDTTSAMGLQLIMPNDTGLLHIAEQLGSAMNIPGVEYHEEPIISGSRK
jgi:hypothetical protein